MTARIRFWQFARGSRFGSGAGPARPRSAFAALLWPLVRRVPPLRLAGIAVVGGLLVAALLSFALAAFVVIAPIVALVVGWQAWSLGRRYEAATRAPAERRPGPVLAPLDLGAVFRRSRNPHADERREAVDADFVVVRRPQAPDASA